MARRSLRPHLRKMTWVVLLFNLIMLIWVIAGSASGSGQPKDCGTLSAQTCNSAQNAGTAIGVGLLIGLWVAGDVILGIIWLVTRPSRSCPVCGHGVKRGATSCRKCHHDFAAAAAQHGQAPATG